MLASLSTEERLQANPDISIMQLLDEVLGVKDVDLKIQAGRLPAQPGQWPRAAFAEKPLPGAAGGRVNAWPQP